MLHFEPNNNGKITDIAPKSLEIKLKGTSRQNDWFKKNT